MNDLINQAKEKKAQLVKEIDELNIVIAYLEKSAKHSPARQNQPSKTGGVGETRTAKAGRLCIEFLNAGHIVSSAGQFQNYVESKGVILSKGGLDQALKRVGIVFNKQTKTWGINNQ